MTVESLRKAHQARPFIPFTIWLADGRRLLIPEPNHILVPPNPARTLVVLEAPNEFSFVDLLLVTSLDFHPAKAQRRGGRANGNGRKPA